MAVQGDITSVHALKRGLARGESQGQIVPPVHGLRTVDRNRARIQRIAARAPSDLAALALLFEDDGIEDDGTVSGRLRAVLQATERSSIPGLQTRILFGDTGFAGNQRLGSGGRGFRDPWPSSRNQVGHFLTAVRLCVGPEIVSRPIPVLGSIRRIVRAPRSMSDAEVAMRLAIGHEKGRDPLTATAAALTVLETAMRVEEQTKKAGVSLVERRRLVLTASIREGLRQIDGILGAFRTQFAATTDADLAAWNRTLEMCAAGRGLAFVHRAVEGARSPLNSIAVANLEGNSMQDLRLTLVGWRLGQLTAAGEFAERRMIGAWLRRTLG